MTLLKKNHNTASSKFEFLIITASLIAILILLRLFSKVVFSDYWIGSLGLISVVFGMILFLAKKEKLGVFGQMLLRQIIKNNSGVRKWIIHTQMGVLLLIGILIVFSIHVGNNEHVILKQQVISELEKKGVLTDSSLNYAVIQNISSQISPKQQIESIGTLPLLIIQDFKIFSVVMAVTDHLMDGWVMYFWQVILIESVEFTLFLGLTRKFIYKNT